MEAIESVELQCNDAKPHTKNTARSVRRIRLVPPLASGRWSIQNTDEEAIEVIFPTHLARLYYPQSLQSFLLFNHVYIYKVERPIIFSSKLAKNVTTAKPNITTTTTTISTTVTTTNGSFYRVIF